MKNTHKKIISLSLILAAQAPIVAQAQSYNGVILPKINWVELRDTAISKKYTINGDLLKSELNKLSGRESEVALALSSRQGTDVTVLNPSPAPLVIASYNQYDATLRLDALRLEKVNGRTKIYTAQLDPSFGEYWRAAQTYANPDNKADSINPFEQYRRDNSRMFHGVSAAGAGVIVSHAAQLLKAPISYLGVPQYRGNIRMETKGRWYGRKIIAHYETYAAMDWYQGSATLVNPDGAEASVCAQATKEGESCPTYRKTPSFLRFKTQEGGTYPTAEQLIASYAEAKRDYGKVIVVAGLLAAGPGAYLLGSGFVFGGGVIGGAGVFEWNDRQVEKFEENKQSEKEAANRSTDSVIIIGVNTPIAESESLSVKQTSTSPLFPSQRLATSPGDNKLNQIGYEVIRQRSSADPFRGTTYPHTAELLRQVTPEAYIERNLTLDNTQLSNTGYVFTQSSKDYNTAQERKGASKDSAKNPQNRGNAGIRNQIN